jgi:hypothetical protein
MVWIILGVIALALAVLVRLTLVRIAGDSDRKARRVDRKLDPFAGATTTRSR